jgi:hypothetical protein
MLTEVCCADQKPRKKQRKQTGVGHEVFREAIRLMISLLYVKKIVRGSRGRGGESLNTMLSLFN